MHSFERFSAPYNPYNNVQTGRGGMKKFWKKIKPTLKTVGKRALKHGLKLGSRVAGDIILKRKAPGAALKTRVKQTLQEIQRGEGIKKRTTSAPRSKRQATVALSRTKTTRPRDIFDY